MDLDVIVVTHQSEAALDACFSSLPEQTRRRFIVVDNASTDRSVEIARAHGARVLAQPRNLGFAQAANIGARVATASSLCFLNPDCLTRPELFEVAVDRLRSDPDLCLTVELREPDNVVSGCQSGYSFTKLLHDTLITNYRAGRLAAALRRVPGFDDVRWQWPHGACFFVARERFLRLGGFDERYFLYMEDVDFGRRHCRSGGKIAMLDHTVQHQVRQGACVSITARLWHLDAARVRYAARHHGRIAALAVALTSAPGFIAHAVRDLFGVARSPSPIARLKAIE